jgi:hypothetical protein
MDMPGSIRHGLPTFLKIPYATISGRSLLWSLLLLLPYAPELNPQEDIWQYL